MICKIFEYYSFSWFLDLWKMDVNFLQYDCFYQNMKQGNTIHSIQEKRRFTLYLNNLVVGGSSPHEYVIRVFVHNVHVVYRTNSKNGICSSCFCS